MKHLLILYYNNSVKTSGETTVTLEPAQTPVSKPIQTPVLVLTSTQLKPTQTPVLKPIQTPVFEPTQITRFSR